MKGGIAIHFARFGPYHLARLRSVRDAFPADRAVFGFEISSLDLTYEWKEEAAGDCRKVTVFPNQAYERIDAAEMKRRVTEALDRLAPAVVAIAGWGTVDARACLAWCRRHGALAIVMSETREADGVRVWWKELLKSRVIRRFDAALVGGASHQDYLVKLGLPAERIRLGYNVVDNGYFQRESARWRNGEAAGRPYFLASNRFIARKNLARLIEAFAAAAGDEAAGWDLCLLGDGELKRDLTERCAALGLEFLECAPWQRTGAGPTVYFPGFCQIDGLPRFYAQAACFVHPALEEPWGLVINEAMASGLPVLSSSNVGAAEELVADGVNGWRFDPGDTGAIGTALRKFAALPAGKRAEMGAASEKLLEEKAATAAFGAGLLALAVPNQV